YTEPYYTDDGISRQLGLFFREIDTGRTLLSDYVINNKGMRVHYGIPLTEYSRFGVGVDLSNTEIIPSAFSLFEVQEFLDINGNDFDQLTSTLSYVYDSRNRSIFATTGTRQNMSVEAALPLSDLEYYKFNYIADYYWPVSKRTLFHFKYNVGAGFVPGDDDDIGLPFFEKYVAGGINTLRGYEPRSIAPRGRLLDPDTGDFEESKTPLGGDLMTVGSLEYILPPLGDGASSRAVLFYDFGNVFEKTDDFDVDEFRSSYGVALNWLAPIGPMTFSYSYPLEYEDKDRENIERFDFSIGGVF
ncbi:MAG TPA: BamA/TamA family outer membrane protein, partial [Gammaproteobacteria bacterium]